MKIQPEVLRRLRGQRGLSQERLAEEAKVDKQTVHRLEAGVSQRARGHTLRSLATALRVRPGVLTGEEPAPELPERQSPLDDWSELTVQIDTRARNALILAQRRYQVRAVRILELAPFLFVWAAEASLRRRRERLDALEEQLASVLHRRSEFQHLSSFVTSNYLTEEVIDCERKSIDEGDLFGAKIPLEVSGPVLKEDYTEGTDNPLACFLRDLAGEEAYLLWFDGQTAPLYEVCRGEAADFVGGNEQAAEAILSGAARLHEMPREIAKGTPGARAAWAIAAGQVREEAMRQAYSSLYELDLDLPDLISPDSNDGGEQ